MPKFRNLCIFTGALLLSLSTQAATNPVNLENSDHSATMNKAVDIININSADKNSLHQVKGIGPKKAAAIIDYREKNGPFKSIEDLLKVKCRGINQKWLTKIRSKITV